MSLYRLPAKARRSKPKNGEISLVCHATETAISLIEGSLRIGTRGKTADRWSPVFPSRQRLDERVRQRVRIRFGKEGRIKFISHHDLMRLFERAVRRAHLPIRMSEGFNPRPRISFPLALAVGVEGREEIAELELAEWTRPDEVRRRLQRQFPIGLEVKDIKSVGPSERAQVSEITYELRCPDKDLPPEECIRDVLRREDIIVQRRQKKNTKSVNIRPYIRRIRHMPGRLELTLRVTPTGTARLDEVAELLMPSGPEVDRAAWRVSRTRVRIEPQKWRKRGHRWQ